MRIATFNIKHGAQADGQLGDPDAVAEACHKLNADIIALQEVDRHVARSRFADIAALAAQAAGMDYIFAPTMRMMGGQYGNALLFKGELLGDPQIIPLHGGYRYRVDAFGRRWSIKKEPRNAILARLQVAGGALSVANTHLSVEKQVAKAQLPQVANALMLFPGPHVLLGDLNLTYHLAKQIALPDGMHVARVPAGVPVEHPKRAIDHMVLHGLEMANAEAWQMPFSDHRAIIADVDPTD